MGAALVWAGFMYCFWRLGNYLPGVPPPTDGIFRMQQAIRWAEEGRRREVGAGKGKGKGKGKGQPTGLNLDPEGYEGRGQEVGRGWALTGGGVGGEEERGVAPTRERCQGAPVWLGRGLGLGSK